MDPSGDNAIPDVALQRVAVESPDRARHAFENILEVFPVSLEALEQILFDLVLIWERSLSPPIVLVFVGLPLHLVDCLIPCILQKQVLHNLLPFTLNYLDSDHIGLCSAASEPLHAKVVDQSYFSQALDSLLQLLCIIGINQPQNKSKLIAEQISHSNVICLSLLKVFNPDLSIFHGVHVKSL